MNAHSEITIPHETDFIIPVAFILDRVSDKLAGRELIYGVITQSSYFPSLREYIDLGDIRDAVYSSEYNAYSIFDAIYSKIAKSSGAKIAGDKSPNDLNFLRILVKVGGLSQCAKVIHIVRDVRDVMVSLNREGWVSDLDLYFPRFWSNANLYLNAICRDDTSNYALIKYEDFVANPQQEIERLCVHLGVSFEAGMLFAENRHPRYESLKNHPNLYASISGRPVGKYKSVLDNTTLRNYEHQALEALNAFNYMT